MVNAIRTVLVVLAMFYGGVAWTGASALDAPRSKDAGELKARATQLLQEVRSRYQSLSSYSDRVAVKMDIEIEGDLPFHGGHEDQDLKLALAAPNRLALEGEQLSVYCDGNTLWSHLAMFGQYTESQAPSSWAEILRHPDLEMASSMLAHPAIYFLKEEAHAEQTWKLRDVLAIEDLDLNGSPSTRLKVIVDMPQMQVMSDAPVHMELWISRETGLLQRAITDITEAFNDMMKHMAETGLLDHDEEDGEVDALVHTEAGRFKKYLVIAEVKDVKVDAELPETRFVFKPGDESTKVTRFAFGSGANRQVELVSKPAPDFILPQLDGDPLSLSSLRGQVVLLDFWALWCSPCVAALPHIQKIHEHFEGKPVTILGVNRDQEGSEDRILQLLERRGVTFSHVLDAEGDVAQRYLVRGIPCTVLIDAEGVVQDVGTGFAPSKVDEMIGKIEKLLAGERVYDPEEVAQQIATLEGQGDDEDDAVALFQQDSKASRELREQLAAALGNPPAMLVALDLPRGMRPQAWQARLMEIEDDGSPCLVIPQGRVLRIVSLDGDRQERITLAGLPSQATVHQFTHLGQGENLRWIVGAMKVSMTGRSSVSVSMHDRSGGLLWIFTPELPREVQATIGQVHAADLDGDGLEEIVVSLQAMRMSRSRKPIMANASASYVLVLDQSCRLLAHQHVGSYIQAVHVTPAPGGGKAFCA